MATFNQVRRNHANMARLLHVLFLRHKTLEQGERPDFHLMREVVDYTLDYINGFITPLERLYSEYLFAREAGAEVLRSRLAENHQALRVHLDLLSENLDIILMDTMVPMERITADLKAYLDAHRDYLRAEREQLFPFFREHLTDEEQKSLLNMLPSGAQANLSRLREDYPQLYTEFKGAPSPFS